MLKGINTVESLASDLAPLECLKRQRSHILFVLSEPKPGHHSAFLEWYQGQYRRSLLEIPSVLAAQHYQQHEVDITLGRFSRLPFRYLGLHELVVDGAEASACLIDRIDLLHRESAAAEIPATWLYYPVSEKVGRSPSAVPSMLTLAFANGLVGQEAEFREWYSTRHIRHALKIPALVSGQCFERTLFQKPGALEPVFEVIAVYEQEGSPQAIISSFSSLPAGSLDFPTLDTSRFAESVYQPL